MAIVSMTGLPAQGSRDGARWRWEAKSVNGRSLDLRLRLPPGFDFIEAAARMLAADRFKRGNVQPRSPSRWHRARAGCASTRRR